MKDNSVKSSKTSIKLWIDSFTNQQFILFFSIMALLIGVAFFLSIRSPAALVTREREISECYAPVYEDLGYDCSNFDLSTNPILNIAIKSHSSQNFIALQLSPILKRSAQISSLNMQIEISAYASDPDTEELTTNVFKLEKELDFDCTSRSLVCEPERVLDINNIVNRDYFILIRLMNAGELIDKIQDFELTTTTLDESYNSYLVSIRLMFLIGTVTASFLKANFMKNVDPRYFTQEQQALKLLTPFVLVGNIPLVGFASATSVSVILYTTNFIVLSAIILWLWMSTLYNIAGKDSSAMEKSSKFIKVFLLSYFAIAWLTYNFLAIEISNDPLEGYFSQTNRIYSLFRFALYSILLVGVFWSAVKVRIILKKLKDVGEREIRFFWFNAIYIFFLVYLIATGGLYFKSLEGPRVLLFPGLCSAYLLGISFLLVPTQEGMEQAQYLKKYNNPATDEAYKDLEMSIPKNKTETSPTYHTGNEQSSQRGGE